MIAVATTYFQIFASRLSLTLIDQPAVLCQAILYLASKSEEEHRRLRDIITVVHRMKFPGAELLHLGTEHTRLRDHIVSTEQLVLRVLGFNLNVELPYNFLYNMFKLINSSTAFGRLATAILNDFYAYSFILEFEPSTLAAAAIFLAAQLSKSSLVSKFQEGDQIEAEEALSVGGGESRIDPNSSSLALDCILELGQNLTDCIDIATRMMKNYSLPAPTPFTFDRKSESVS